MELSVEKSNELALIIKAVQPLLATIDTEYARALAKAMRQDINMQQTMAVLNPRFDPAKLEIIRVQAESLDKLAGFVEDIRKAGEMKSKLAETDKIRQEIDKYFL